MDLRDQSGNMPLVEIGIGPGFSNSSVKSAVEDLCKMYHYDVEIYAANTPYARLR